MGELVDRLRDEARGLGMARLGIARAMPRDGERLHAWLAAGRTASALPRRAGRLRRWLPAAVSSCTTRRGSMRRKERHRPTERGLEVG